MLALTLGATLALAAEKSEKQPEGSAAKDTVAVIETNRGTMVLEFWSDVAPETVKNFQKLANKEFYNGTCFHRIVKGFMIQGGDPLTKDLTKKDLWGTGNPGYTLKAEFSSKKHVRGVISMARGRDPNSAGCQFFICLGTAPHLDGGYTAFGKVVRGEDVLIKIGETPTTRHPRSGEKSIPTERIEVKTIKIIPRSELKSS